MPETETRAHLRGFGGAAGSVVNDRICHSWEENLTGLEYQCESCQHYIRCRLHQWLLYARIGRYCNAIHANTRTMYWYCGMYWWYVLNTCQHVLNTNRFVFNTYLSVFVCIVLVLGTVCCNSQHRYLRWLGKNNYSLLVKSSLVFWIRRSLVSR